MGKTEDLLFIELGELPQRIEDALNKAYELGIETGINRERLKTSLKRSNRRLIVFAILIVLIPLTAIVIALFS